MRRGALWRNREFLKFWAGQTVSEIGSRITREGLPLTAVLTLHATPVEMGVLAGLGGAAAFLAAPAAGLLADRAPHRAVMIAADLGRALLLALIPLAAFQGVLTFRLLAVVAALTGALTVVFDVVYRTFLPVLVGRDQLLEGNSKLASSFAAAEIVGPELTGILVQWLSAPRAILIDALSFVVSAVSIAWVKSPRVRPAPAAAPGLRDGLAGIAHVARHPVLRALALRAGSVAVCYGFFSTLYVLYAIEVLRLTPIVLGFVIALGGVSNLTGALAAEWLGRRYPVGRILIGASLVSAFSALLIPLARGPWWVAAAVLGAAQLVGDAAYPVYSIHELTLRQRIAPPEMLGRVNAAIEMLFKGLWPAGALAGGAVAAGSSIRVAFVLAGSGLALSTLWLVFSPLRSRRFKL